NRQFLERIHFERNTLPSSFSNWEPKLQITQVARMAHPVLNRTSRPSWTTALHTQISIELTVRLRQYAYRCLG
ncbi:MAG: hypothetical protein ACK578_07225, partial [Pirellula sp.]